MKNGLLFLICCAFDLILNGQGLSLKTPVRMLALGDSYTIGQGVGAQQQWPRQLLDSLANRGFTADTLQIIATTGWRTDNLISAITGQNLRQKKFNLVSLLIGVNNQYQGSPFPQYKIEFPQLLDSAIAYAGGDKTKVIVMSIPDYAYTPFGQQSADPSQISAELDQYNLLNKHYADSLGITYFDITPISRQGLVKPAYVAQDGLHPSGAQYAEWVRLIMEFLDKQHTGIKDQKKSVEPAFGFSPNPSSGKITLHSKAGFELIEILDLYGRVLMRYNLENGSEVLDISDLPVGMYYLRRVDEQFSSVKILMKL